MQTSNNHRLPSTPPAGDALPDQPQVCASEACAGHGMTRRVVLGVGLSAGTVLLAACTGSSDAAGSSAPSATPSAASSSTASSGAATSSASSVASSSTTSASASTATSTETSSEASSEAPTEVPSSAAEPTSSAAPVPSGPNYGAVDAIPEGSALIVGPEGAPVALARTGTDVVAFSAVCTHQGCTVNARGTQLVCPCHASKFNPLTGAVEGGPAPSALPAVTIQVVDGTVYGM